MGKEDRPGSDVPEKTARSQFESGGNAQAFLGHNLRDLRAKFHPDVERWLTRRELFPQETKHGFHLPLLLSAILTTRQVFPHAIAIGYGQAFFAIV
jgi:hypothetical protein